MSSLAGRAAAGNARHERRVGDRAASGRRLSRQVGIVLRREIPLSLRLILLVLAMLPWVVHLDDGWSLWVTLDRDLAVMAFFFTLVASVVAFLLGQRDVRNAITELQGSTVASRRDVVLARMIGMVVATWLYLSVLVGGTWLVGLLTAAWGRPDARLLVPLYLWPVVAMPLLVALGDRTSQLDVLRPVMWLVIAAVASWFAHLVAWYPFVVSTVEALPWPGPPPGTVPNDAYQGPTATGAPWQWLLIGSGLVGLAALALPARFGSGRARARNIAAGIVVTVVVGMIAMTGVDLRNEVGYPARMVTGDLTTCVSGDLYEACGHPAYEGLLEKRQPDIAAVLSVVNGVDALPVEIRFVPVGRLPAGNPPFERPFPESIVVQAHEFAEPDGANFRVNLVQQMFAVEGWYVGDPTVANVVRAWWMLELGFTPEDTPSLAIWMGRGDLVPGGASRPPQPDLSPYVERFAALPDDERIAWLNANWDALRAGDLTLEDLP